MNTSIIIERPDTWDELCLTLLAWLQDEGPLRDLLIAWLEVITGEVIVDDMSARRQWRMIGG